MTEWRGHGQVGGSSQGSFCLRAFHAAARKSFKLNGMTSARFGTLRAPATNRNRSDWPLAFWLKINAAEHWLQVQHRSASARAVGRRFAAGALGLRVAKKPARGLHRAMILNLKTQVLCPVALPVKIRPRNSKLGGDAPKQPWRSLAPLGGKKGAQWRADTTL